MVTSLWDQIVDWASNKILTKFLEMWVFPLKIKEKILVKKKVIQKAS